MKKIFALLMAMMMLLTGCYTPQQKDENSLNIVTTIFAPYDFARSLTADVENVNLTMLLKPGMESHTFEPTPKDMITVQNADVFIYVGGESDEWVNTILDSIDTTDIRILTLMDCVELYEAEYSDSMEHDHDHEDEQHHEEYDEHVWTSPRNAMLICERIKGGLIEAAPQHSAKIEENYAAYKEELNALDEAFIEMFASAKRNGIIMGDRFPFLYFAKAYGMQYDAAFPGCSAESEPNAKTLASLIDKVNEKQIPAVFHMELSNEAIADAICESTGAKKLLLHACHGITSEDFEGGATYLSLMNQNLEHLKEALN